VTAKKRHIPECRKRQTLNQRSTVGRVSAVNGSSAEDHGDFAVAVPVPDELPENVIPLRPQPVIPTASPQSPRLEEADPTNPAHTPTPIFGRAAINLPEWPTVLVFAALAVSLTVVLVDSFRRGALLFGMSLALAFFLRLVLTDREAGMLKVRSRVVDLIILGLFAASITGLAFSVPVLS
jgi:hypothetical protein